MRGTLNIGKVAHETGLPVRTIRFYEEEGVVPAPSRTRSGYRAYTQADVRRLRLARNARGMGLTLVETKALVAQAFASDCRSFAPHMLELIAAKRRDVAARMKELRALQRELDELERHVTHASCATEGDQMVADCDFCPAIDEEGAGS